MTVPTQFIQHGKVELESHPYIIVFLVYSEGYQTRCKYQNSHKTFDTQFVLSAKYARAMVAENFWEYPTNDSIDFLSIV